MVDVFDRHEVRFDPRLAGCSKFVRHSDYATLEAQLAERVKVKTLEWTRGWMNAEAQTEIGQYTITYRRDGSFEWGIGILKGWASSWDEAKAAAQADYERRILSALEPHPRDTSPVASHETVNVSDKPEGQQEPVAEAAPLTRESLQQTDAVWSMFYRDGRTLGDIAEHFGVSIYALSPWLTAPLTRHPEPVVDTEPWGYWVKHKYAEGGLVREPCFVPEESHYTEVLPLFTRPSEQSVTEAMAIRDAALEEAAKLIEEGYERPRAHAYRRDGKPSKNDMCEHEKYMYEDCEPCAVIAIRALKAAMEAGG